MATLEEIRDEASRLLRGGELDITEIWLGYLSRGGNGSEAELDAFISGLQPLKETEVHLLGIALREIQEPWPEPI